MKYHYKATQNDKVVHEFSDTSKHLFIDRVKTFHLVEASDVAEDFLHCLRHHSTYAMSSEDKVEFSKMQCKDTIGDFTIEITITL